MALCPIKPAPKICTFEVKRWCRNTSHEPNSATDEEYGRGVSMCAKEVCNDFLWAIRHHKFTKNKRHVHSRRVQGRACQEIGFPLASAYCANDTYAMYMSCVYTHAVLESGIHGCLRDTTKSMDVWLSTEDACVTHCTARCMEPATAPELADHPFIHRSDSSVVTTCIRVRLEGRRRSRCTL